MGLGFQQVHTVAPGGLSQIPNVPREGTQLMELGSATEWQITAGARFPLPSPEVRDALIGAGALEATPYIVPLGSLAQIPTTPHDGARVREFSSSAEWQVAAGAKFPLPDAMVRNQLVRKSALEWRLNIVPDGTLAALPTAPRDGARVQELASNAEWQIASGMKFALTDAGRREALIAAGAGFAGGGGMTARAVGGPSGGAGQGEAVPRV